MKPEIRRKVFSALLTLLIHGGLAYLALTLVSPVKIFVDKEKITNVVIVPPEKLYLPYYGVYPAGSSPFNIESETGITGPPQPFGGIEESTIRKARKKRQQTAATLSDESSLSSGFRLSFPLNTKENEPSASEPQLSLNLSRERSGAAKIEGRQTEKKLDFLKYLNPDFPGKVAEGISSSSPSRQKGIALPRSTPSFLKSGYDLTPWAKAVVAKIQKNWLLPAGQLVVKPNQVGVTVRVKRNGQLVLMKVDSPSQVELLDQAVLRAINLSLPLPQLPNDFPEERVEVYLVFEYHE